MNSEEWDIEIKPNERLLSVDFRELWRYRDLCTLFVRKNIVVQYKQTILGPLWYLIQPMLTVVMFMVVFGGIAGIPTDGVPQPLFYLGGICLWQYFADCLNATSNTFVNNAGIFGKVYFPRLIMPLANVISNLLRFGIQFGLFIVLCVVLGFYGVNWYALLFPLLVVVMAGLSLGFGIIISSMTTKYHDLQVLFGFIVQLWMYATPIVYPLSSVVGKNILGFDLYFLMALNPVTPVIETFKYGFLGAGEFIGWEWLAYSFAFMVVLLGIGVVIFNKVQRSFMDTV